MSTRKAQAGDVAEPEEAKCGEHGIHPDHVISVRHHLLSPQAAKQVAALFGVLADPTRLQVVNALLHAPSGELCVCDLANGLGRDDTTISHQLRVLRHHQVVATRKVGRVVYYRLTDDHISRLLEIGIIHSSEQPIQRKAEVIA